MPNPIADTGSQELRAEFGWLIRPSAFGFASRLHSSCSFGFARPTLILRFGAVRLTHD
jgi:hypothetical protein